MTTRLIETWLPIAAPSEESVLYPPETDRNPGAAVTLERHAPQRLLLACLMFVIVRTLRVLDNLPHVILAIDPGLPVIMRYRALMALG